MDEVSRLLAQGDAQKRRSATAMNEHSTRAHTVIVLSLTQRIEGCADIAPQPTAPDTPEEGSEAPQEDDGVRVVRSKLFLADLGGSEKVSKSKADDGSKPKVMLEANPEAPEPSGDVARRGWVDVDGNWVESDGGGGMASEGQWVERERITWAEYVRPATVGLGCDCCPL